MERERWLKVKEIVGAALEMAPDERAAYLDGTCGDDTELRREVESLLDSHEEGGHLLETPAWAPGEDSTDGVPSETMLTRRFGPYRVVSEIGRGGMGVVYRAVRADNGPGEPVAIKLIRRGLDSDAIQRRFRQECRIAASLEHPNIARILEGGATADGMPYFVMEYVEGKPIHVYCDEKRLSTEERLRLFLDVCAAMEHAHERMIVHRDIKPGNILVRADGVSKLLDFGIAKTLDPGSGSGLSTMTMAHAMTPEYASPEQIQGRPITGATDIYSLGVLLYELLTGHRPHRARGRAPHEVVVAICRDEPEKPSTAIEREEVTRSRGITTVLTAEVVSERRHTDPDELRRSLAGDLDCIVLKAIRKEPHRRYASVRDFAADIRRHLDGLPVRARRDAMFYDGVQSVRRHKALFSSLALAPAAIVLGLWLWPEAGAPPSQVTVTPFTTFPGDEVQPAFSPQGDRIAFAWRRAGKPDADVYVRPTASGGMTAIAAGPDEEVGPCWSPDGSQIAFLRTSHGRASVVIAPSAGGAERILASLYPTRLELIGRPLDWSADGRHIAVADKETVGEPFAIYLISVEDGSRRRVTSPPAGAIGDTSPQFCPDGRRVSFLRGLNSGVNDVWVTTIADGQERRVTSDNRTVLNHAWLPDGRAVLFSSVRAGAAMLWRIRETEGEPSRLLWIGPNSSDPAVSRDGGRLAYSQFFLDTNIWRFEPGGAAEPVRLVSSTQQDSSPQFSPDGGKIAFRSTRSGHHEIWVCDREGQSALQLTSFRGPLTGTPRWSPDGRFLAFDSRPDGQADIFVMPAEGGAPRRLTGSPSEDVTPSWSRDGQWVYFASNRGGSWQVWKTPAAGGAPQQVTKDGGFAAFEDPAGEYVYYAKGRTSPGLWRVRVNGGGEAPVLEKLRAGFWGYWAVTKEGVWFADLLEDGRAGIFFQPLPSGRASLVVRMEKPPVVADPALAISPDGKQILYSQIDQRGADILVAESPTSEW